MADGDVFRVGDAFSVKVTHGETLECLVMHVGDDVVMWPTMTMLRCLYFSKHCNDFVYSWYHAEDPDVHPLPAERADAIRAHYALVKGTVLDG